MQIFRVRFWIWIFSLSSFVCSVAKTDELKQNGAMDVGDQPFEQRLLPLQVSLPRANGVAKRTFDHRVHRFGLPTLSKQTIQTRLSTQIGSCAAFRAQPIAAPSRGWDPIVVANSLTSNTRVSQYAPGSPLAVGMSRAAGVSPEARQRRRVAFWSSARTPGHGERRNDADGIRPLCPLLVEASRTGSALQAFLPQRTTSAVRSNPCFFHANIIQKLPLNLLTVCCAQRTNGALKRSVVKKARPSQLLTDLFTCQQPRFPIPVAQVHREHQQPTSGELRQGETMGTFGVRGAWQLLLGHVRSNVSDVDVPAFLWLHHTWLPHVFNVCNSAPTCN